MVSLRMTLEAVLWLLHTCDTHVLAHTNIYTHVHIDINNKII